MESIDLINDRLKGKVTSPIENERKVNIIYYYTL